eukprot:403331265
MKNTQSSFGKSTNNAFGGTSQLPKSLLNKKNLKQSDVMLEETKMMEDRLEMVKRMMEVEKEKRDQMKATNQGTMWRSATTNKGINGYTQMVLSHHKQKQPNLPPTTLILRDDDTENINRNTQTSNTVNQMKMSQKGGQNQGFGGFINPNDLKKQNSNSQSSSVAKNFQSQVSSQQNQNLSTNTSTTTTSTTTIQTSKAASNLSKALQQQTSEFEEVDKFLSDLNMLKYKDTFLDNGVEDLEIILELDEKHLEQMSVPLGHKLKILKRIKDMRRERGMQVPESRQGGERPKIVESGGAPAIVKHNNLMSSETNTGDMNSTMKKTLKRVVFADEPTGGVGTDTQPQQTKKSNLKQQNSPSKQAPTTCDGGVGTEQSNSLLDGEYDEAEQQRQFMQALEAWRNAGKKKEETGDAKADQKEESKQNDQVNAADNLPDNVGTSVAVAPQKKNFLLNYGENDDQGWSMNYDWAQFDEKEIIPDLSLQDVKYAKKESCWHCFRMFIGVQGSVDPATKRVFCGMVCLENFQVQNTVQCQNIKCKKSINKTMSMYARGKWYCGTSCADQDSSGKVQQQQHDKIEFYQNNTSDNSNNNVDDADSYNDELGDDFEL